MSIINLNSFIFVFSPLSWEESYYWGKVIGIHTIPATRDIRYHVRFDDGDESPNVDVDCLSRGIKYLEPIRDGWWVDNLPPKHYLDELELIASSSSFSKANQDEDRFDDEALCSAKKMKKQKKNNMIQDNIKFHMVLETNGWRTPKNSQGNILLLVNYIEKKSGFKSL